MINFKCLLCGGQFNVKSEAAGRRVKCPGCAQVVVVPRSAEKEVEKEVKREQSVRQSPIPRSALLSTSGEFKPRNYRDLKIARVFLTVVAAFIILVGGVFFVFTGFEILFGKSDPEFPVEKNLLLLPLFSSVATLTSGALLLAFSELIVVAIDIQENTQKSAYMLSKNE